MSAELSQENARRRIDELAVDISLCLNWTKEEAMEWIRERLTGEAKPVREFGSFDTSWRSE